VKEFLCMVFLSGDVDVLVISWSELLYNKGCWVFSQGWVSQDKLLCSCAYFAWLIFLDLVIFVALL
jgi:hypothetical protein